MPAVAVAVPTHMPVVDDARRCKAPQRLIGLVVAHPSGRCDLAWRPVTIRRGSDHWVDGALDLAREMGTGEALEGVVGRRGGHRRTNLSTAVTSSAASPRSVWSRQDRKSTRLNSSH